MLCVIFTLLYSKIEFAQTQFIKRDNLRSRIHPVLNSPGNNTGERGKFKTRANISMYTVLNNDNLRSIDVVIRVVCVFSCLVANDAF